MTQPLLMDVHAIRNAGRKRALDLLTAEFFRLVGRAGAVLDGDGQAFDGPQDAERSADHRRSPEEGVNP